MEAAPEEQNSEAPDGETPTSEAASSPPHSRFRDLIPEKDPMGAGSSQPPEAP